MTGVSRQTFERFLKIKSQSLTELLFAFVLFVCKLARLS
jgi:hypothetical protein